MNLFKDVPIEEYEDLLNSKTKEELVEIALSQIKREKKRIAGENITDSILEKAREHDTLERANEKCNLASIINWVVFDFDNLKTRPEKYGKYLICRKDGKLHWEQWNGTGWAYNHNSIKCWARITPPCL